MTRTTSHRARRPGTRSSRLALHALNPAHSAQRLLDWWLDLSGGPARARAVLLLGSVLGLDTADLGSIGAIAGKLEHALSLTNTRWGSSRRRLRSARRC
jgi:hypothetical protein